MINMILDEIKVQILELENRLLDKNVRHNPNIIREILSEDFEEITSSGKIYKYKVGDIFSSPNDEYVQYEIQNFDIKQLSLDLNLVRYIIIKTDSSSGIQEESLRSSIWQQINNNFKIIFHQGTKAG